jgi:hypothetical protein
MSTIFMYFVNIVPHYTIPYVVMVSAYIVKGDQTFTGFNVREVEEGPRFGSQDQPARSAAVRRWAFKRTPRSVPPTIRHLHNAGRSNAYIRKRDRASRYIQETDHSYDGRVRRSGSRQTLQSGQLVSLSMWISLQRWMT